MENICHYASGLLAVIMASGTYRDILEMCGLIGVLMNQQSFNAFLRNTKKIKGFKRLLVACLLSL